MKDWFAALESREQYFVAVGAIVVVLGLLYGLIWAPFDRAHDTLRADVETWQSSLQELRPLKHTAKSSSNGQTTAAAGAGQSPIIVVDQTLRSRGLDPYRKRSQPTTSNGIRVEFENVAFDDLVLWLGDLSRDYNMNVQAGSFSPGSRAVSGRVNATLTLERAL